MNRTIAIYVNELAANKQDKQKLASSIQYQLEDFDIDSELIFTKSTDEFKEQFITQLKKNITEHVVIGGDGSLQYLVDLVCIQDIIDKDKLKLGILPAGTGNDWLKTFTKEGVDYVIAKIISNETRKIDIGKLEFKDKDAEYFTNIGGFGFSSEVIKKIQTVKWMKGLSYYVAILLAFFNYKSEEFSFEINGEKFIKNLFILNFGIGKYAGGSMLLCPNAIPDDGLFDINIVLTLSKFKLIFNIFRLQNGTYLKHLDTISLRSSEIIIHGDKTVDMEVDGELVSGKLEKIICLPQHLTFFV